MSQARLRTKKKTVSTDGRSSHGLIFLLAGMVLGSLATIMWQGMRSADGGVGTGIRTMIEQSKQKEQEKKAEIEVGEEDKPVQQQTNFDFYTVLPEIEVVVPNNTPEPVAPKALQSESDSRANSQADLLADSLADSQDSSQTENSENEKPLVSSAYMLQAGSYQNKKDADRLKAELALKGHQSQIQKVTIQGRGDFYRVRLGPYINHNQMVSADDSLAASGIKALRLKISKGG